MTPEVWAATYPIVQRLRALVNSYGRGPMPDQLVVSRADWEMLEAAMGEVPVRVSDAHHAAGVFLDVAVGDYVGVNLRYRSPTIPAENVLFKCIPVVVEDVA